MTPELPTEARTPCQSNPDRQFPKPTNPEAIAAAKFVCLTGVAGKPCPLLDACREDSLHVLVDGVWGGLDAEERKQARERAGIIPEPIVTAPHRWNGNAAEIRAARRAEVARLTSAGASASTIADRLRISARAVTRNRAAVRGAS
jgi:hypothetical protein